MNYRLTCITLLLMGLLACDGPVINDGTPVPDAVGKVVNLDQGWSEEMQDLFWFTPQGSHLIPYEWFLALEQADNEELFRSDANMDRLRFLPATVSKWNPDALPIGIVKDPGKDGKNFLGLTCAACHTGQVEYNGTGIRIDGGPSLFDLNTFLDELGAALKATNTNDAKFTRFSEKVGGNLDELRSDLVKVTTAVFDRIQLNKPPTPAGFGRVDAFGNIFNQVTAHDLGIPENGNPPDAPVSYPFLWDTPQHDVVQWNGSASNRGAGPLVRNVGEVLGVFGTLDIPEKPGIEGYPSSANVKNMGELEKWVESLWSPLWPEEFLPKIDPEKAALGEKLYEQNCLSCHALIDRTDPKRRVKAVMIPVEYIGTDPTMATNGATRRGKTGRLKGVKLAIIAGPEFKDTALDGKIVANGAIGALLHQPVEALESLLIEFLTVPKAEKFDPKSYKARPHNGIWATAPYLHNGSVPNLKELLTAPGKRSKIFWVGSRKFDPVNVGYVSTKAASSFAYDTSLPGNHNTGHTAGTGLSNEEKMQLIEYLKTL